MPDLRKTRRDLTLALVIMAGIDVLALVLYISPLVGSPESRKMQLNQMQTELNLKTRQVMPLQDLPDKVVLASRQIGDFYKRFPNTESQILGELGKVASANGVSIEHATYKVKDAGIGGLQPVQMEAALSGSYTSLAKFINALERDEIFFIIDSVDLGGQPQGPVKLSVKLEAYLKAGS